MPRNRSEKNKVTNGVKLFVDDGPPPIEAQVGDFYICSITDLSYICTKHVEGRPVWIVLHTKGEFAAPDVRVCRYCASACEAHVLSCTQCGAPMGPVRFVK